MMNMESLFVLPLKQERRIEILGLSMEFLFRPVFKADSDECLQQRCITNDLEDIF